MKKSLSVIIAIMTILSTVAIMPVVSVSAENYKYPVISTTAEIKGKENADGRITLSNDFKKLYATAKGKKTVTIFSGNKITGAVLRGKTIFYTYQIGKYCYLASATLTGGGKKIIYKKAVANDEKFSILAITGNNAIIKRNYSKGSILYKYDVVKKKFTNLSGRIIWLWDVQFLCGRVFYYDEHTGTTNIVVISSGKKTSYKNLKMGVFSEDYRVYRKGNTYFKVDRNYTSQKIFTQGGDLWTSKYVVGNTVYFRYTYGSEEPIRVEKVVGNGTPQNLGLFENLGFNKYGRIYDVFAKAGKTYVITCKYVAANEDNTQGQCSYYLIQTDSNLKFKKNLGCFAYHDDEGQYEGYEVVGSTFYGACSDGSGRGITSIVLK